MQCYFIELGKNIIETIIYEVWYYIIYSQEHLDRSWEFTAEKIIIKISIHPLILEGRGGMIRADIGHDFSGGHEDSQKI